MPDKEDYPETPAGYAARWTKEFAAAKAHVKPWWERGDKIVARFVDDRKADRSTAGDTRLNLFTANTQTLRSLLYGKTPQVDVARRFADSEDDQARVASEMMERILNTDLEKDSDTAAEAFRQALDDRLLPGMGNVKVGYDPGEPQTEPAQPAQIDPMTGQELAPEVPEVEHRPNERVYIDYVYWKDQLFSPCRTFNHVRWWAFGNEMSEAAFVKRFGKEKLKAFTDSQKQDKGSGDEATKYKDDLARCYVWEIWSKERKTVDYFVEGAAEVLDHTDDPLGLEGFWPFPRPLIANPTTSKLIPTPDYALAQDLYEGIDTLESRIDLLEDAIRVAGLYDQSNEGVKRLLEEKGRNALYPVDAWAAFAEKGGIKGAIDWLPLDQIVGALDKLRECRTEKIGLLYQTTGMSDIMRGQASQQTTATEQAIKARFASVRVQSMQDEFARFCSDTQRIKAEIISKHFEPQTIIERSNIMRTPDAQFAEQAVQLIKDKFSEYRITVNPDSVSLTDFAALKQERGEFAQTIATYFQGMMPLAQMMGAVPGAAGPTAEFIIGMGQELVAGLHGANEMEGIFDQYVAALKQIQQQLAANPPPPQPNPQLEVAKVKAGAEQFKAQADVQSTQLDMAAKVAQHHMEMHKLGMEQQAAQQDHNRSMQSQEGQERIAAMKQVDRVTGGDQ
jgi:hypothetical protein